MVVFYHQVLQFLIKFWFIYVVSLPLLTIRCKFQIWYCCPYYRRIWKQRSAVWTRFLPCWQNHGGSFPEFEQPSWAIPPVFLFLLTALEQQIHFHWYLENNSIPCASFNCVVFCRPLHALHLSSGGLFADQGFCNVAEIKWKNPSWKPTRQQPATSAARIRAEHRSGFDINPFVRPTAGVQYGDRELFGTGAETDDSGFHFVEFLCIVRSLNSYPLFS